VQCEKRAVEASGESSGNFGGVGGAGHGG
jgi:hypothetical protein